MLKQPINSQQNHSTVETQQINCGNRCNMPNCIAMKSQKCLLSNIKDIDLVQLKSKNLIPILSQLIKTPSLNNPQLQLINNNGYNYLAYNTIITRKARRITNKKDKNKTGIKYGQKFTPEEDAKLRKLVEINGTQKWDLVAEEMPGRNGRQCRDRYMNYLIPGYFTGQWSKEEDMILRQKFYELGPQWSKIADFLKNRSSNAVKNRWNYFVSKHLEEDYQEILTIPDKSHVEQTTENQNKNEINENSFDVNPLCDFFDNENEDFNFEDDYFELNYLDDN